jgi:plastocyanin
MCVERLCREAGRLVSLTMAVLAVALLAAATAEAKPPKEPKEQILQAASYPDMTTYSCRTNAITIYPGQNLNLFASTKTCPNAQKISGPGDASVFNPGSTAQGFVTRFQPSMVEIKPDGRLVTPSVWDLHLHHVVWLSPNGGPTFASGEEKSIAKLPQGYGIPVGGDATWGLNYMIHNLTSAGGRQVYITWDIDWVPQTTPARTDINPAAIHWLDVAGAPHVYPVFDARRSYDANGDGQFVFPDEVSTDPSQPSYAERGNISTARTWTLKDPETLIFGAGHLHPGGMHVDLQVARDGADAGTVDGDDPAEIRPLFQSNAHYYEPAGAVSWDVSMEATRPDWRISLKAGDTVSINVTYDVRKASWYEVMGILPLAYSPTYDPSAKDPFDDDAAVKAMYDQGGILTHGRLPENIDSNADKNLHLADPRDLKGRKRNVAKSGIAINGFLYSQGGYSAIAGFPANAMRPPTIKAGQTVTFTNEDALFGAPDEDQVWHSITSCKAPCNRGSGIGYPLARGPIDFDSGQLGFGTGTSTEVTTGSAVYTTPALNKPGTYTYFCRIHPFMRGSIRVKG